MRDSVCVHLRPAGTFGPLNLVIYQRSGSQIIEGILKSDNGKWFPILHGVPSFLTGSLRPNLKEFCARYSLTLPVEESSRAGTREQAITTQTFSDKWRKFKNYGFEAKHQEFLFDWYRKKFALPDHEALKEFYRRRKRVLEVGPGSGFNTRFIAQHCQGEVFALDISEAAFTTYENTCQYKNCTVVQADLMESPFADGYFDLIVADGVLHHAPDTRAAVEALYRKVMPDGQFFFYLYKKMGPVRQFSDQYIRERFTKLGLNECYDACKGLTELGRELSRLNAKITLTTPIPVLGIPAGTHDVQRLLYYNFVKCFWNDAFDYETNNMVNFDWYHPHHAWQHDPEEVVCWLEALGVTSYTFNDANPNGISVLLTKPAESRNIACGSS